MALFLVQHGKCLSKDVDPEKGLSDEGTADVKHIAEVAKGYGVRIDRLAHSGKKRARQTAEIMGAEIASEAEIQKRAGLKPLDDVTAIADELDSLDNLMLVGHLPFMERLTSHIITGSIEKPVLKFQNGGIVCLEQESDNNAWFIKWTLMPDIS